MKKIIALIFTFIMLFVCAAPTINASETAAPRSTTFNKNSNGAMVVRIQQRLRELGYLNFKPTGSYKSMTERAVKDF
ncbi:MAG: peptidoglycan-binding protein [Clostridia bacterium]|nr:peptidoglycan-binding protein [Clostridia bacterium]